MKKYFIIISISIISLFGICSNILAEVPLPEGLTIHYITTYSDSFVYSLNSKIPISIIFTEPVTLQNNSLTMTLETGEIDQQVIIEPFLLSYTATAIYTVGKNDFSDDLNVTSIVLQPDATLQNSNGEDVITSLTPDGVVLTLPPEGNLKHIKNIYVDGTTPTIQFEYPSYYQYYYHTIDKISGKAGDCSGNYLLTVSIIDNNENEIFPPTSKIFYIYPDLDKEWEFDTSNFKWQDNMVYTITALVKDFAGNTKTEYIHFYYGKRESSLTIYLSNKNIIVDQSVTIKGTTYPMFTGEKVYIDFYNPSGKLAMSKQVKTIGEGIFYYTTQLNEINIPGTWTIKARWNGNSFLTASESSAITLLVSQANCEIKLGYKKKSNEEGEIVYVYAYFVPYLYYHKKLKVPINLRFYVNHQFRFEKIILIENYFGSYFELKNLYDIDLYSLWSVQASINSSPYQSIISEIQIKPSFDNSEDTATIRIKTHAENINDLFIYDVKRIITNDVGYVDYDSDSYSSNGFEFDVEPCSSNTITVFKEGYYPQTALIYVTTPLVEYTFKLKPIVNIKVIILMIQFLSGIDMDQDILEKLNTNFQKIELETLVNAVQMLSQLN